MHTPNLPVNFAAVYNERVMSGAHMESVADLAIRTALVLRGVAHITIPVDVQVQAVKKGRSERNPVHHTSAVPAYFDQVPARVELEHAADILNRGKKIAILVGGLFDQARRCDFFLKPSRSHRTGNSLRSQPAVHKVQRQSTNRLV